jgi:prepilin-type N-terminal cleavage/methylation domain-containing protein
MNKKWFTLIEMLIVIVIIGILLTLSMRISWDRIQVLKTKSVWEQIVYNYNNLYVKNLLTNYYNWEMYENMVIRFSKWDTKLNYFYDTYTNSESSSDNDFWLSEIVQWWNYEVESVYFNWNWNKSSINNQTAYVIFEPYKIWCKLSDKNPKESDGVVAEYSKLNIDLLVNWNKKYCLEIPSDLCKMEVVDCK